MYHALNSEASSNDLPGVDASRRGYWRARVDVKEPSEELLRLTSFATRSRGVVGNRRSIIGARWSPLRCSPRVILIVASFMLTDISELDRLLINCVEDFCFVVMTRNATRWEL